MPKLFSSENQALFIARLAEHVTQVDLKRCAVIFHGGEPLLAGAANLAMFAQRIRAGASAKIDVGLQTNGLLLSESALDALEAADIGVSLSIDGPKSANDLHRTTRRGRSSFDKAVAALERLKARPKSFAGVIAVIDVRTSPRDLFSFFSGHAPPRLDFLLPDAHHLQPPPDREQGSDIYARWLIEAFDLWLDEFPHLPVRTFEALLDAVAGMPSGTDAFGFGDVSLISIETDGTYHDLDVLKITKHGATQLNASLSDTSIGQVSASSAIATHRELLRRDGLCAECQRCGIVDICGGGSLPHRYGESGFNNPTVYCADMKLLVAHVKRRLGEELAADQNALRAGVFRPQSLGDFEYAERAASAIESLCKDAADTAVASLRNTLGSLRANGVPLAASLECLDDVSFRSLAIQPGVMAWRHTTDARLAGRIIHAVDGVPLETDLGYLTHMQGSLLGLVEQDWHIGEPDPWLRLPFGAAIDFEDDAIARRAHPVVHEALEIVERWRPALAAEMRSACRAIQFVRDPSAHPDKIVSFSDNSVPGALYVSVMQGDALIDAHDLADSLIHEHRHQKLYLLERQSPMVEPTNILVKSPWREAPRPPSGLLHAAFVFVELDRFWTYVRDHGPRRLHNRATNQLRETTENLAQSFKTLEACPLTPIGRELVAALKGAVDPKCAPCPID